MCYIETTRFVVYSFWREVGGLFEIDTRLFIIVMTIHSNNALYFFFFFFSFLIDPSDSLQMIVRRCLNEQASDL